MQKSLQKVVHQKPQTIENELVQRNLMDWIQPITPGKFEGLLNRQI